MFFEENQNKHISASTEREGGTMKQKKVGGRELGERELSAAEREGREKGEGEGEEEG